MSYQTWKRPDPALDRACLSSSLLKDPKIVVLDEATSALDSQTEVRIQKAPSASTNASKSCDRPPISSDSIFLGKGPEEAILANLGSFWPSEHPLSLLEKC